MPAYQDNNFSLEAVQNYFSHLNPIAQRIAGDICDTKSNFGHLWYTLNSSQQNDIINETLIKPEISLHYFDNFSLSQSPASSSSSTSYENVLKNPRRASSDSLTAIASPNNGNKQPTECTNKRALRAKMSDLKNYYAYDGRNLKTFGAQKVALKIVHDDALGTYRDEHSAPFSYRTKSQINLHVANNADISAKFVADDEVCLLNIEPKHMRFVPQNEQNDQRALSNYIKLQTELKKNLNNTISKAKDIIETKPKPKPLAAVGNATKVANEQVNKTDTVINSGASASKSTLIKAFIDTTSTKNPPITYAIYTDTYYEHGESSNLMQNCGNSGILTASSSSAATSDEDDDEKTLCEDVKLLDNDINLRKGFDFLNNW